MRRGIVASARVAPPPFEVEKTADTAVASGAAMAIDLSSFTPGRVALITVNIRGGREGAVWENHTPEAVQDTGSDQAWYRLPVGEGLGVLQLGWGDARHGVMWAFQLPPFQIGAFATRSHGNLNTHAGVDITSTLSDALFVGTMRGASASTPSGPMPGGLYLGSRFTGGTAGTRTSLHAQYYPAPTPGTYSVGWMFSGAYFSANHEVLEVSPQ